MQTLKIVKIGGKIIDDASSLHQFLQQFATISTPTILVHGGGRSATQLATQMNIPVTMVEGRRITDAQTLDLITMVYAGKINKNIVAQLQANNCNAIGFSGADGNTIIAEQRPVQAIDYGFAGDITAVQTQTINLLLKNNITPVFCAITHDKAGQLLNTNADTIASALASSFATMYNTELYYCFEKKGVLQNADDENSVLETLNMSTYKQLVANGAIAEGMHPKLDNCFQALKNNVATVAIGKPAMLFDEDAQCTTIQL